ncbi:MAG: DUF1822 family protein [Candidatus Gastranaerophilales bacterium]|nr:DUF1822 family protein [Candidatus Gastranaerophilales bacterium]
MNAEKYIKLDIDEKAYSYAKIYSSLIQDQFQRKRAYASITALYAFINLLEKTSSCEIQKSMTLFRNPALNEQYEISDLYVNNWHLDVRVLVDTDAVIIPRVHYNSGIVPDFYVIVKVDSALKHAELAGIAVTENLEYDTLDYNYYSIKLSNLISYESFLNKVKIPKKINFSDEDHKLFKESYLGIIDNEIDLKTKNQILKHLFECSECRTEFCCFTGFEMVNINISKYPEILDDKTLNIVGAQAVDNKEYEGKEEIINIKDEEKNSENNENKEKDESQNENENTQESFSDSNNDETVSDILDELFSVEEDFISDEPEEKPVDTTPTVSPNITDEAENEPPAEIINENIDTPEDEIVIIEDNDAPELDIQTENDTPDNNVQRVIVDYDEAGEPVYSYITEIDKDNPSGFSSEIEPIEDDDEVENLEADYDSEILPVEGSPEEIQETSEIEIINDDDDLEKEKNDVIENNSPVDIEMDFQRPYSVSASIKNNNPAPIEEIKDDNNLENEQPEEIIEPKPEFIAPMGVSTQSVPPVQEEITEELPDEHHEEIYEEEQTEQYEESHDSEEQITGETEQIEENNNYEVEYNDENPAYSIQQPPVEKPDASSLSDLYVNDEPTVNIADISSSISDGNDENTEEFYDDGNDFEGSDIDFHGQTEKTNNSGSKAPIVIAALVLILAIAGGSIALLSRQKNDNKNNFNAITADNTFDNSILPQQTDNTTDIDDTSTNTDSNSDNNTVSSSAETVNLAPITEKDLIKKKSANGDINAVMANAFSQNVPVVSIKNVNWLCTSELFSDKDFKSYLQNLDNMLKLNLKKNILDVVETPEKDTVSAKFAIDNSGNLEKVIISDSSGSEQIDDIVLQSINEIFEGENSPVLTDGTLKADKYYLKVVIKL